MYTPPAGDAVDLVYIGGYTPPAGDSVDLVYSAFSVAVCDGVFTPPAVTISADGLTYSSATANYNPPLPVVESVGTNAAIGVGRFKAPKIVCKSLGYSGELVSAGKYGPPLQVIGAQGSTGIYGWGAVSPRVPRIDGAGAGAEAVLVTTGVGKYTPPKPTISGLSLAPTTGAIRFSPPKVYVNALGSRTCRGNGAFFPSLPRVKGLGLSGAGVQGVLEYDRDPITSGTAPAATINPLSFSR